MSDNTCFNSNTADSGFEDKENDKPEPGYTKTNNEIDSIYCHGSLQGSGHPREAKGKHK